MGWATVCFNNVEFLYRPHPHFSIDSASHFPNIAHLSSNKPPKRFCLSQKVLAGLRGLELVLPRREIVFTYETNQTPSII